MKKKEQFYIKTGTHYLLLCTIKHHSRYNKIVTAHSGMISDGATGAKDIHSKAWWIHDVLCNTGLFDDGTKCSNLQASMIIYDILREEGRWFRARTWWLATLALGGGEARKNGLFKV